MPKRDPETGLTYGQLRALDHQEEELREAPYREARERWEGEQREQERAALTQRIAQLEEERGQLEGQIEELKSVVMAELPSIPIPSDWDGIFDWYYRFGKPRGMTLKGLAALVDRSPGTIYNNHGLYLAEHGEAPISHET